MSSTYLEDLTGDYVLDPTNTRLGFVARHAMVTRVHGVFETFHGTAHIDLVDPSRSTAEVDIEAGSVTTGIKQRDAHLRTSDFLDVPHHPVIAYRSTEISRVDHSTFHMLGDLTIRGVTNPLALEFHHHGVTTDAAGNVRVAFTASSVISRRAWGVSWSAPVETGGLVVADAVTLELDVCALRVRPASAAGSSGATTNAVAS